MCECTHKSGIFGGVEIRLTLIIRRVVFRDYKIVTLHYSEQVSATGDAQRRVLFPPTAQNTDAGENYLRVFEGRSQLNHHSPQHRTGKRVAHLIEGYCIREHSFTSIMPTGNKYPVPFKLPSMPQRVSSKTNHLKSTSGLQSVRNVLPICLLWINPAMPITFSLLFKLKTTAH